MKQTCFSKEGKWLARGVLLSLVSLLTIGCNRHNELFQETAECVSCKMHFQSEVDGYDKVTKSAKFIWPDKSRLYIRFHTDTKTVTGWADYSASDSTWLVTYYSEALPKDEELTCEVFYFTASTYSYPASVKLAFNSGIYESTDGAYTLTDDGMYVVAKLLPRMARIRFKGIPGTDISVSGLCYNNEYDFEKGTYTKSTLINCEVQEDGFTPYIYGTFQNPVRPSLSIIYIENDIFEYSRSCTGLTLNPGQSGWMTLPTEAVNMGWTRTERPEHVLRVETDSVYGITTFQAKACGTITDMGQAVDVIQCGHVWSTESQPTIDSPGKTELGRSTSATSFVSSLLNLEYGTEYHIRAYARTDKRVVYGKEKTFTTISIYAPSLSAVTVTGVTASSANWEASVTSQGNGTVYSSGFCYSTGINPTLMDNVVTCENTTQMDTTVNTLSAKTTYYVRAFAINEKGTNYGEQTSFKTSGSRPDEDGNPPASY